MRVPGRKLTMKKKAAAKKEGKRKRKGKPVTNVTMEGANGKYDKLYNAAFEHHVTKKPDGRTPASLHMMQDNGKCAAAKWCNSKGMPLST